MLSEEHRHLVKIGALDALEKSARESEDEQSISTIFEDVFEALHRREKIPRSTVLEWGLRYIAWANEFPERDGLPFSGTSWAKLMYEVATAEGRIDLAKLTIHSILSSYAPLQKERLRWEHEKRKLDAGHK